MDRDNPYEAAFEAYLRARRLCYVAVDETRRALLGDGGTVRSLDFIVYGPGEARLLVDVKGRRFPGGPPAKPRRVWECWAERDGVEGLQNWETRFGPGYVGVLVFMYHVLPSVELPTDTPDQFEWRGHRYLLRAVSAGEYARQMRVRSPKWGTMTLPRAVYRELVKPFRAFTDPEEHEPQMDTDKNRWNAGIPL